ncbi:MAG: hypothetical protein K2Q10_00680, partial [Rhodospirillales bacterium]|nr:hypothetical protein [Rhodospirillales bacterium]
MIDSLRGARPAAQTYVLDRRGESSSTIAEALSAAAPAYTLAGTLSERDQAIRKAAEDLSKPRGDDPLTAAIKEFKKNNKELLQTIRDLRSKKPLAKDAKERVARVKEQLKALMAAARMAMASGNKALLKSLGREITRLARELSQASKDMSEAARAGAMNDKEGASAQPGAAASASGEGAAAAGAQE